MSLLQDTTQLLLIVAHLTSEGFLYCHHGGWLIPLGASLLTSQLRQDVVDLLLCSLPLVPQRSNLCLEGIYELLEADDTLADMDLCAYAVVVDPSLGQRLCGFLVAYLKMVEEKVVLSGGIGKGLFKVSLCRHQFFDSPIVESVAVSGDVV